jgi:sulfur carrier protein
VKLWVNGKLRDVHDRLTVSELLKEMDVVTEAVAVEVNAEVVRRALHNTHCLAPDDRVEVVTFVGGG